MLEPFPDIFLQCGLELGQLWLHLKILWFLDLESLSYIAYEQQFP